ncbi:MAG: NTP transferase domain-containing protein [Candidatus Hydrogenedentes bacterium]|nr:NTP transferase domain-containing protein [Candidatus Hydrogenedentota bacterium]
MTQRLGIASVILCAGKGRRMGKSRIPKVCFPVAGKPAILHTLDGLSDLDINPNILVVGHLAGKIVDEVGPKFPNAIYAYQADLLGTGHAAKQGVAVLRSAAFAGGVLIIAGDKNMEPRALRKLIHAFETSRVDMALLVAPKKRWPDAGRIVTDQSGHVLCCIEKADITHAAEVGRTLIVHGETWTAEQVEASAHCVNQATYLFRAEALFAALDHLGRDNVQAEEYLTDCIDLLVQSGKTVLAVPVDDPDDVLAFNNPQELLEIEEHFRKKSRIAAGPEIKRDPRVFKSPRMWAQLLSRPDAAVNRMLIGIYGDHPELQEEKRARLLQAVELFVDRYGSEGEAAIIRAPGRVNLMGRHVDHRGGAVNLMAIDREQIMVARGRDDARVRASNMDRGHFDELELSEGDLLKKVRLDDWVEFVNSAAVVQMVRDLQGHWGNYLKAPLLRLQQQFKDRQIYGVDCVIDGDIPMAAGLSSSSALVVAMADALVLTNNLAVSPHDLVDVCGEGEWFVGTRGGSADHAAVKLSQFGQVAHVSFFPFAIKGYVPFPKDYSLVICNSRIHARKAEGARDTFNERVASYEFAVHLVRKRLPKYAPLINHLRDISPEGLGISPADIYRLLLRVPERITPGDLVAELGEELCAKYFATHRQPEEYHLRGRLLYGVAECARSARCLTLLQEGRMEQLGVEMNISHNGDRVVDSEGHAFAVDVSDNAMHTHIENLRDADTPRSVASQLHAQPGLYACSISEIYRMVDVALGTPGVLGAQLSGAGLGGCMMVLAKKASADQVIQRMTDLYYAPNGLEPGAISFTPIAGSGPLTLDA